MRKQIAVEDEGPHKSSWRLLSINEASAILGLCRRSVEIRLGRKELKSVRIGRRVLIREADLISFVQKRVA